MTPLLASAVLAAAAFSVAAPGIRCTGVDPGVCDTYLEHFATVLSRTGRVSVRTRGDLEQVLSIERQKQLLGCDDSGCVAELMGALGVDGVLSASLAKTEGGFVGTLRVLRSRDGQELAAASERLANAAAMEEWLERQATELADKLAPAPPVPARQKVRLGMMIGGAALLAAGLGLYISSKVDARTLNDSFVEESRVAGLVERGKVTQLFGSVLSFAGAAVLVGSLVWALLDSGAPAATVAPLPGGGALLTWRAEFP